jgi:hypothetical protein
MMHKCSLVELGMDRCESGCETVDKASRTLHGVCDKAPPPHRSAFSFL